MPETTGTSRVATVVSVTIAVAALFLGCGEKNIGPEPPDTQPAQVAPVPGSNNQSAVVGNPVATPPSVTVTNKGGTRLADISVTFVVKGGNGTVTGSPAMTNASGTATVGSWTLGDTGDNTLEASIEGLTVTVIFVATATPDVAASLKITEGDGQSAVTGTTLAIAPSVTVLDQHNNPVPGVTVAFTPSGDGHVTGSPAISNANGVATVGSWTLGTSPGLNTLGAGSAGLTATFNATALALVSLGTQPDPPNGGITTGDGEYVEGRDVTVSATANAGYQFVRWTQDTVVRSTEPTFGFTMTSDQVLTARFRIAPDTGNWSPGGTYSDWLFPDGAYQSIEWTFIPVVDPPASLGEEYLIHYYAYNFAVTNATPTIGGGYAGFQTYTAAPSPFPGTKINYAIWGANGGLSDGWVNTNNGESGGFTIVFSYSWQTERAYRFRLAQGPSGVDGQGKWWGLWVIDMAVGDTLFVGELRVPATLDGKDSSLLINRTSFFGEDTHWWRSLPGQTRYVCSDFAPSALAVVDVTANETVRPLGVSSFTNSGRQTVWDNGYVTYNCHVTLFSNDHFDVQHNLGFWPYPAPNRIEAR